jgi:hypothetical protein
MEPGADEQEQAQGREGAGHCRSHSDEIAYLTGGRLPAPRSDGAHFVALARVQRLRQQLDSGDPVDRALLRVELRHIELLLEELM